MSNHKVTEDFQDAVSNPAVQVALTAEKFSRGWQTLVTADAASGNGQNLTVKIFGGHTVDGATEYHLLHEETVTTADFVKPDGTTEVGRASSLVQDPWGMYDEIVLRLDGTGTWTIRSSVRTYGSSF